MLFGIGAAIILIFVAVFVIALMRFVNARTARLRNKMMRDYVRRTY